ncbi:MAG: biotin--[acetyl-CoA-carboxylase] ligase [Candidatus Paceibacterota bacterium]|jgi:BirA family biotin operon repressor/biotin-[acetyl-CoA-carboxylase] ligase|nr:biotin--[acetyl-CoA-carboxylase] ligase [bacterium]
MSDLIIEYDSLPSTSLKAKELVMEKCDPWTVVFSLEQTQGHGKSGVGWFSPRGGLYFSIILPQANIKDLQIITVLAAFVVAKIIKENFDLEAMIKLPNDILVNNKKFCGILTENIISGDKIFSIIGVGVNTNIMDFPENLNPIATSVLIEAGRKVDNKSILEKIVNELKSYFIEINN